MDPAALEGKECYGGLDLASIRDLAAFALVFPAQKRLAALAHFWCPRETALDRENRGVAPSYFDFAREGLLTLTEGNVIDYGHIRKFIGEWGARFPIRRIAVDRWNAASIITDLGDDGFTMVPFGQGFGSMSAPTKELDRLVASGELSHGGNPVLRWMASNAVVSQDPAGNLKPNKEKAADKIDGIVALIMAIGTMIAPYGKETGPSIYETRGVISVG